MQDAKIVYPNLGLKDNTDKVNSIILKGPRNILIRVNSCIDIKEVYTNAVKEPCNTPSRVISRNNTYNALSDTFRSLCNNISKADDDNSVTKSKHSLFNLPTYRTIIFSAVAVKEGSLLIRALQEYKLSLTLPI